MSQREVAIVGKNNTRALVTGQEELLVKVNTIGPVDLSSATLTALENTTVSIAEAQFTKIITPNLVVSSGSVSHIADAVYSISFASNGTGPAIISVDGNATTQSIPAGTTINLDAGGLGWYYDEDTFYWDTTASGASLIITYNT